jgi:hypothetical protein
MTSVQPYVQAALISAIPATFTAFAAWYAAHKSGKQGHEDNNKIDHKLDILTEQQNVRFERIDTQFARMDLRFDSIEDKVERHLDWHRTEAELHLPLMLSKETQNGGPDGQRNT